MADIDFKLLANGEIVNDASSLMVGQSARFVLNILPHVDMPVTGVDMQLEWRTYGAGDGDKKIICSTSHKQETLNPKQELKFELVGEIPADGPVTHKGKVVSFIWEFKITLHRKWKRNITRTIPLKIVV